MMMEERNNYVFRISNHIDHLLFCFKTLIRTDYESMFFSTVVLTLEVSSKLGWSKYSGR